MTTLCLQLYEKSIALSPILQDGSEVQREVNKHAKGHTDRRERSQDWILAWLQSSFSFHYSFRMIPPYWEGKHRNKILKIFNPFLEWLFSFLEISIHSLLGRWAHPLNCYLPLASLTSCTWGNWCKGTPTLSLQSPHLCSTLKPSVYLSFSVTLQNMQNRYFNIPFRDEKTQIWKGRLPKCMWL